LVLSTGEAAKLVEEWKRQGLKVVFTNGVFDLLHVGHARYLQAAKSFGDRLIVGVNSDESTRAIKGPRRPIVPEGERAELVAALKPVDAVVIFDQPTASELIGLLEPDVYVKGEDWKGKPLPEAETVESYGGVIRFAPFTAGRSSTDIVRTILERYCGAEDDR
jgi:rfaE bifunctional protein nucleotidyltransferase chain/domain